jgi:hypothetical protein
MHIPLVLCAGFTLISYILHAYTQSQFTLYHHSSTSTSTSTSSSSSSSSPSELFMSPRISHQHATATSPPSSFGHILRNAFGLAVCMYVSLYFVLAGTTSANRNSLLTHPSLLSASRSWKNLTGLHLAVGTSRSAVPGLSLFSFLFFPFLSFPYFLSFFLFLPNPGGYTSFLTLATATAPAPALMELKHSKLASGFIHANDFVRLFSSD